jgi:hemolysin activation/secretion protein
MKHLPSRLLLVPLALVSLTSAPAQTPPNAGSIQQQNERALQSAPTRPAPAEPQPLAPPIAPPSSSTGSLVTVTSFRFAGNTLLSSESLAPVVAPYLNRPLDFGQLQAAANAVGSAYRDAGWIVRTFLPAQNIEHGVVTIQVVEAVFGGVKMAESAPTRVNAARALAIFASQLEVGAPLKTGAIDRALFLANDLPGLVASGSLRAGAKDGETELVVTLADEPLLTGVVTLDNAGLRATGQAEASAHLSLNSPFGFGDLITADTAVSRGSLYLRLAGSLPVGHQGWRVGLNGSYLHYKLVTADFSALDAHGTAESIGLNATYPLIRSRRTSLYFQADANHKTFDNRASGFVTTRYNADILSLGLSGSRFDDFWGGGANSASLTLVNGHLDLGGSPNRAFDAATTRTAGYYAVLRGTIGREQAITRTLSLLAGLSGQLSNKNLDSSEKMYLGGVNGVRAYPTDEGGGSQGGLASVALRQKLGYGLTLSGFYDYGYVVVNRDNDFTGHVSRNAYSLQGAGPALNWQGPKGISVNVTWARRLGHNPNATSTGTDQDGSLVKNRIWLSASLTF